MTRTPDPDLTVEQRHPNAFRQQKHRQHRKTQYFGTEQKKRKRKSQEKEKNREKFERRVEEENHARAVGLDFQVFRWKLTWEFLFPCGGGFRKSL